jgi:predicted acetyltransferase
VPELIAPTSSLYAGWRDARDDWGPGLHEDGFGLRPDDDTDSQPGFEAWLQRLQQSSASFWWIVEDRSVLGAIALRSEMNEIVWRQGHIGYGIRPSARGRGLATWALGQVLSAAQERGLERVLIVCDEENVASARVIESHGGVREDIGSSEASRVRRYWISLRG